MTTPEPAGGLVSGRKDFEMRMTKKYAKEILDTWKDQTNYFDGSMTLAGFENMLIYRFHFGQAEAFTISMALILAGAKFAD